MKRILEALFIAALLALAIAGPTEAYAEVSVGVSVNIGPPALPYYPQPLCPGPGYIWAPGYWAYGDGGYFWVPGTWIVAPAVGLLWTPGYWGWRGGYWWWHAGYWGPHVGFYGGIHYGYGYPGVGFVGGYWHGNAYYYNRSITNVNITVVHNTYNQTVPNEGAGASRVSFNGGTGGTTAVPTHEEEAYAAEQHTPATKAQTHHEQVAMKNPAQRFSQNNGHPDVAATTRPGKFKGNGAVRTNATHDDYEYHPSAHAERAPRQPHQSRPHPPRERGGGRPPHHR